MNKKNILGQLINGYKKVYGKPLKYLTVLSNQNDPYRLDTPANHRDGQWLSDTLRELNINPHRIHLRGLHYQLVGRAELPEWKGGGTYHNTDENWLWLAQKLVKAARWLGYIEWEMFEDQRNSPPEIFRQENKEPSVSIAVADVEIYLPDELSPEPFVSGYFYRQPYQFALIAEKAGVGETLRPLAKKVYGELILPTGEISDTLIFQMLARAEEDGRPLVIFSLGDFDPAGNQMAISIARKVQAMTDTLINIDAQVLAPAMTLEQCKAWGLPSTPLKSGESRAEGWVARWGWEQTELDAAVALAPRRFKKSIWQAMECFWDEDVARKNNEAKAEAIEAASLLLDENIDDLELARIRGIIETKLDGLAPEIDDINESLAVDAPWLEQPDQRHGDAEGSDDWIQSSDDWLTSTELMRARKGAA